MKRILIVEDNSAISKLLGDFLRHRNFEVSVADSIVTADNLIATGEFDLAFMDNQVFGGNTIDGLIQRFRQKFPNAPMVMISGSHLEEQMLVGGGNCYSLPKPFYPQTATQMAIELTVTTAIAA